MWKDPISWPTYIILYILTVSLDILLWPTMWCTSWLPAIAGLHVLNEFWGVLRLMFGESRMIQPVLIGLTIVYEVAVISTAILGRSDLSILLFTYAFLIADSGSLILGLYTAFSATNSSQFKIGMFFLIHGALTVVIAPLYFTKNYYESDNLIVFLLIFSGGIGQVWFVKDFYNKTIIENDFSLEVPQGKNVLLLMIVWALWSSVLIIAFTQLFTKSPLPCLAHQETIMIGEIIFPLEGVIGILVSLYFFKNLALNVKIPSPENKNSVKSRV